MTASAAAAPGGISSPGLAAGVQLPARGQVLMLFERAAEGDAWQLASASLLAPGVVLPELATDSRGHVLVVPLATAAAAWPAPTSPGPLQAAVVDDGPASAAAKVVASGPLTTGIYQHDADHARWH